MGMLDERKRRCSAGYTRDPCPGCKVAPVYPAERLKDELCDDCTRLLADAREWRASQIADGERRAYYTWRHGRGFYEGNPTSWYGNYRRPKGLEGPGADSLHDAQDWIRHEFRRLVDSIGEPVAGQAGRPRWDKKPAVKPAGSIFPGSAHTDRLEVGDIYLLKPSTREALFNLDRAIRVALAETAANSLKKGSDLLASLAVGRMTGDAFDETIARDVSDRLKKSTAAALAIAENDEENDEDEDDDE